LITDLGHQDMVLASFDNRGVQNERSPYFVVFAGVAHGLIFLAFIFELVHTVQSYS
jgi:hypothetical protein